MRIAITGVTGFIGSHLASCALRANHEVVAFSRRPWAGEPYVPLKARHFLDLPGTPPMSALVGVDAVVHLAVAPQTADPATVEAVNCLGTERLFEAARRSDVSRFVFVSSQSAHAGATSLYGKTKFATEERLGHDERFVIVRPGLVYSDGGSGLLGRVEQAAAKFRVFPVVGGRSAQAQTIHVEVLCEALLILATMDDPPRRVELADPDPCRLSELVRSRTRDRFGVTAVAVPIPIRVARTAVRIAERLGIRTPINEETLHGIESFRPMDTTSDMEKLGIANAANSGSARPEPTVQPIEPRRLIIVGAGRIGLIHALTSAHHHGMVLSGIVDLQRSALVRLGYFVPASVPMFTDLDAAIREVQPNAAIIGTPPSSHVKIATQLLEAGVDVLVEKPVAASEVEGDQLRIACDEHGERYVSTGYLWGLLPHVASIADEFRAGRFGAPVSFKAHAFVSRVEGGASAEKMWELDTSVSGGGALINLGSHVLSIVDLLLAPAEVDSAVLVASSDRQAEDGAAVRLRAGGIEGELTTSWNLPGFDMPDIELRIQTDRGFLLCSTSCAAFVGRDEFEFVHQVDVDGGFDLSPLDGGGAFWAEQDLLSRREHGPNSVALAQRVETLIGQTYRTAERIPPPPRRAAESPPKSAMQAVAGVIPDLRGASSAISRNWLGSAMSGSLTINEASHAFRGSIVSVPDAPRHFRTLTNTGSLALVRELGPGHLGLAALGVAPSRVVSGRGRLWEALLMLLRAESRRLDRSYDGAIVVDAYLTDLATAMGDIQPIGTALDDLRARFPRSRVGIEVNAGSRLMPYVSAIASRLDLVVALATPSGTGLDSLREMLLDSTEVVLKTGTLPADVLGIAWDEPGRWVPGDERLVVHWPGAPVLRATYEQILGEARWAAGASPNLRPPSVGV